VETVLTELRPLFELLLCFFMAASELSGDYSDAFLRNRRKSLVLSTHVVLRCWCVRRTFD
jgi:hypothetical protein